MESSSRNGAPPQDPQQPLRTQSETGFASLARIRRMGLRSKKILRRKAD